MDRCSDWVIHRSGVMLGYDPLCLFHVLCFALCGGLITLRFVVVSVEPISFHHWVYLSYCSLVHELHGMWL